MRQKITCVLLGFYLFGSLLLHGQLIPSDPISYQIFSPSIFNPAITGCKEYTSVTFISSLERFSNAQTLSAFTRVPRNKNNFGKILQKSFYTNFGTGGFLFHEEIDSTRFIGTGLSFSYHIPLSRNNLSFLALGISAKGLFESDQSVMAESDTTTNHPNSFTPLLDMGLYFYNAHLNIGLSSVNLVNSSHSYDSTGSSGIQVSRQYFFTSGYKVLINRENTIFLELFLLINTDNKNLDTFYKNLHPGLKVYYKDSYIGTYINDFQNFSFFMHLQFPRIFVGTYVEFPYNSDIIWYYGKLSVELIVGININWKDAGRLRQHYW